MLIHLPGPPSTVWLHTIALRDMYYWVILKGAVALMDHGPQEPHPVFVSAILLVKIVCGSMRMRTFTGIS